MYNLKKKLIKKKKKGKDKVEKGSFYLTFNKIKNNKNGIKRKALFSRKRKRAIIIYQKCIIYKRFACKNLRAYYYAFPEITLKGRALSART